MKYSLFRTVCLLILALLVPALSACAQETSGEEVVAVVDGKRITAAEVNKAIGLQLSKLEDQIYDLKRRQLDNMIHELLLDREASRRNISTAALIDAEVTAKVTLVTEQDVEAFFQANKARLPGDEAQLRQQIRSYLQSQKLSARREEYLKELRSRADVSVSLKAPPVYRAEVSVEGAPVKGSASAPVTIVEYSDFHCTFCRRVQPTLTEVLARYGDKVRLVYRDFPIDSLHPTARKASEAARCANDQGKFWTYHDLLYAGDPEGTPEKLRGFAQKAGLDLEDFDQCLASGKHQAGIQKDVEEGNRLGVTGTPAFFINGRMITGAQPLETFAKLIEEEMGSARPSP